MSLQTIGTEILATPGTEVGVLPASLQGGEHEPVLSAAAGFAGADDG